MKTIADAAKFAMRAHGSQTRNNSDEPYFVHLERVAARFADPSYGDDLQKISYLHDTLEDTSTTYEDLDREFGSKIADRVSQLTNPWEDSCPYEEKLLRISGHVEHMSWEARIIKLADRLDNLSDMEGWNYKRRLRYVVGTKMYLYALADMAGYDLYRQLKTLCDRLEVGLRDEALTQ